MDQLDSLHAWLKEFKSELTDLWWQTDTAFPEFPHRYESGDQKWRQTETDMFMDWMEKKVQCYPEDEKQRPLWEEEVKQKAGVYAGRVLGFSDAFLDILYHQGFTDSTLAFVRETRRFDSELKVEDIFQAIRNVWIINSIQLLLDQKVELTPSAFGYSLLYPYTDNYLDDLLISREVKMEANSRFERRLTGESLMPLDPHERSLFLLVDRIESQYPREAFPMIYQSLLAIHSAQGKSLLQQGQKSSPYERDVLGISMEKGGVSVLADAFLVKGTLSKEEARFMFRFGVILQLADDLQDLKTDFENNHMTVFSQTAGHWGLERITNRLFRFVSLILKEDRYFSSKMGMDLKSLMEYNCRFLLIHAVARHQRFYEKGYIKALERFSPFSFRYLGKLDRQLRKEYRRKMTNSDLYGRYIQFAGI